jgi:acyl-CoA dehydrogenase
MTSAVRRDHLTRPIYEWAKGVMPHLSDTEREAIEAGDVWWDAQLMTGNPDWEVLLSTPPARLTDAEQAFLDGPVETLCGMVDEWKITWENGDLSPQAWAYLKANRFFGLIIPKQYGGLGFSAYAHSETIRKLSTRSVTTAVTAMVPNSLGPGELLIRFGTDAQRDHWLPRLADGREIPCFGLTSPEAGSDAAAMIDEGVVCVGDHEGVRTLGIRLNWHKRYITLGPVATVLGLAFKLRDPAHLLGEREDLGITVALIPTNTKGVEIGRRHLPAFQMFQNGPNWGRDVFIPLDDVIGGPERIGQGWKMLMTALAAGRGVSLPAQSAAATAMTALTTGAYARIRSQFGVPIGKFEGVQARLARLAANAYGLDAARRLTCAGLDEGHHPSVISAIMKSNATEMMRVSVNDAMDVHGGKAIMDGPRNYLGNVYRSVPVGITVEGANILTRSLIVYGQGVIRAHPYLLDELLALGDPDEARGLDRFDEAFWRHVAHALSTGVRAVGRAWTDGAFAPAPQVGRARPFYRKLGRYAAAFALTSDVALLTLGGALKRDEMLSARLGDVLSELYFLSAALKRWEDEGREDDDFQLLAYVMKTGFANIEASLDAVFTNLPNRLAGWLLRVAVLPFGQVQRGPSDALTCRCADILMQPSATRDRLVQGVYVGGGDTAIGRLLDAFEHTLKTQSLHDRLRKAHVPGWREALAQGLIDEREAQALEAADASVAEVIAVDDFDPAEITGRHAAPASKLAPTPGRTVVKPPSTRRRTSRPEPAAEKEPAAEIAPVEPVS